MVPAKKRRIEKPVIYDTALPTERLPYNFTDAQLLDFIELFSDSEDDDDDDFFSYKLGVIANICLNPRKNRVKSYVKQVLSSYTEAEFRHHFRIPKNLFDNITVVFTESEFYNSMQKTKRLSAETYLLVFLWFAGNEACCFRDLAYRFNLSLASVSKIIKEVSYFLSSMSGEIIKWPSEKEKMQSSKYFTRLGFRNAIGCIDGTHIKILPPNQRKDDYIDRKGDTTICLQGICNENKKFINVFVGHPGSCHDIWVLENSPIHEELMNYSGDYYLLGDASYSSYKNLMTPYKDNGHLTTDKQNFNIKLSNALIQIEQTFGMLKQRFRQLNHCKLKGMEKLCHFVMACCVLHNITEEDDLNVLYEDSVEEPAYEHEEDIGENLMC